MKKIMMYCIIHKQDVNYFFLLTNESKIVSQFKKRKDKLKTYTYSQFPATPNEKMTNINMEQRRTTISKRNREKNTITDPPWS